MQACILLSLLSLILVCGVTGLVPKPVVTTMIGTDFGSLATKRYGADRLAIRIRAAIRVVP